MPGGQYGTQNGFAYGTANGAQYGDTQFGTRIELYEPGEIGPSMSITSQTGVSIGLEHTAVSDMELSLPPHEMITLDRFRLGRMAYYADDRLLFAAEIEDMEVSPDRTITLSGQAAEDTKLTRNEFSITFQDVTFTDAIREFGERLPFDVRVKDVPNRRLDGEIVQAAEAGDGFEQLLQAGQNIDYGDQSTWRDLPSIGHEDTINSLHETTPLKVVQRGLTLTQTCTVLEGQNNDDSAGVTTINDSEASGARALEFVDVEDWAEWSFGFEHTIPPEHTAISIRGYVAAPGTLATDRIELSANGSTIRGLFSGRTWGASGYFWANEVAVLNDDLGAGDGPGDEPHTIRLEKVQGDKSVRIDCIAVFDNRFFHDAAGDAEVDENNALAAPGLYPQRCVATFDLAPAAAILDHARIRGVGEWRGVSPFSALGFVVPAADYIDIDWQLLSQSGNQRTFENQGDIPSAAETSKIHGFIGVAGTTLTGDDAPTTTPTTRTESELITAIDLRISGKEVAIISEERTFQGTPMDIFQTMHDDAGRRFAIEHGVRPEQGPPVITSFEARDTREIRDANWVVTDVQRDASISDYANQVTVQGAPFAPGVAPRASATARDEAEIARLADPPDDDGVRPLTIRDESLETVNDCLSKARAILRERVEADSRGGAITTAPALPTPGPQYLTEFFGADTVGGYGMDYGLSYGERRTGHHSALESATYTEESGSASTEMEFEKYSGLYRVVTEV